MVETVWTNIDPFDPGIREVHKIVKCGKAFMKMEFKLFWQCKEGLGVEEKITSAGREGGTGIRGKFSGVGIKK